MGFRANRFHSPAFRFWVRTCGFTKSGDIHLKFLLLPSTLALRWRVWCFSLLLNCLLFWVRWCHRLNLDLSFINPDDFRLFSYQPPPGPDHILGLILMQTCLALQGLVFFFLITQLITLSCKSYWIKCYRNIKHIYWPEWLDISAADLFIRSRWRTRVSHCTTDFLKQELSFRWKLTVHTNCHTACYWPCARWMKQRAHLPKGSLRQGTATSPWYPF